MTKKWRKIAGSAVVPVVLILISWMVYKDLKEEQEVEERRQNLFKYVVDLENPDYTFACRGFDYGISAEDILEITGLSEDDMQDWFIWEEQVYENVPYGVDGKVIDILRVSHKYSYNEEGLWGRGISLYMDASYEEDMRELLYQQAEEYMPEISGFMVSDSNQKLDVPWELQKCNEQIKVRPDVWWVDIPSLISISKSLDTQVTTVELEGSVIKTLEKVVKHTRVDLSIGCDQEQLEIRLSCRYHPEF